MSVIASSPIRSQKMYSRMSEIDKARKDMDKEYAMIKNKLGAMMKKVKASSSESNWLS